MFWMDQNSFRRRQSASWSIDQRSREAAQVPDKRFRFLGAMRITRIFTVLLIILPVALILLIIFQYEPHDHVSALAEARVMEVRALPQVTSTLQEPQSNVASLEDQKGNGGYVDDQKRSAASLGIIFLSVMFLLFPCILFLILHNFTFIAKFITRTSLLKL